MLQKYALLLPRNSFASTRLRCSHPPSSSSTSSSTSASAIELGRGGAVDPSVQQKSSLLGSIELIISASTDAKAAHFPDAPPAELCCGSGCSNCIWVQYADDVMAYVKTLPLHNGIIEKQKKMVRDCINEHVADENLRAFLLMEVEAKH